MIQGKKLYLSTRKLPESYIDEVIDFINFLQKKNSEETLGISLLSEAYKLTQNEN